MALPSILNDYPSAWPFCGIFLPDLSFWAALEQVFESVADFRSFTGFFRYPESLNTGNFPVTTKLKAERIWIKKLRGGSTLDLLRSH